MSLWLMRKLAGSVLDDYFNFVAERISPWENIVMRGIRSGRTLKEHVFSGVFCIYGIKDLLGLGEEHVRLLMSAFTIHDLNKLAQDGISLGRLTDDHKWMKKLISQVGIDRFFIRWEEFYFDLLTLIRFHSGHYNLLGHDFFAVKKKTLLEPGELEKLAHIMKMVDVLDLSVDFAEDDFKKTALFHLNAASARQYRWLYHRLAEHRGVFSNIIHNQVVAILKKRGAWPLLVYPEGVWYLWPVQAAPPVWPELVREVAASTGRVIEGFKVQDLSKVVNMTKDGIKVDESAVNTVRPEHLLAQVEKIIYRRKPKISDDLNRLKHRFERGGRSLEDYLEATGLRLYTTEEEVFKGERGQVLWANLEKKVLAELIEEKIIAQEAKRLGISVKEEEIQREIEAIGKKVSGNLEKFKSELKNDKYFMKNLQNYVRNLLILNAVNRAKASSAPSDQENLTSWLRQAKQKAKIEIYGWKDFPDRRQFRSCCIGGRNSGGCGGSPQGKIDPVLEEKAKTAALQAYQKNNPDSQNLKARVIDYGCHIQVDIEFQYK
ncbi:MAG: SurA N-terminal domain-containing protein [Firmicutes bacterium]|nr:SurA N-terminal domain-containing protein [Bacillota bacterium]